MFKRNLSTALGISLLLVSAPVIAETASQAQQEQKQQKVTTRDSSSETRTGQNESRARMNENQKGSENRKDRAELIKESTDIYRALAKNENNKIPESVLSNARCIAVFPGVVTAALVVGGSHGEGTVSCKNDGKWSAPAYVNLTGGSIGAQVGGKSTDLVLFLTNQDAQEALKKGKFELGADASVVAGSFDRSFETGTNGVVAYQRTEGAFIGASLTGVSITRDMEEIRAQYGSDVDYVALLEGRTTPESSDTTLTSLFPTSL